MKILRLDLIACGPFTDISLDLSRGNEGLHLVYGPNEAGKSSALRALGYFLFGIPDRCRDDFQHPYQKLRIGGALQTGEGKIIEAVRRKGRVNTLRAPDGSLLDEALWHEACGRIAATDFSRRFGIDHTTLVEGGSELVKGEGELADVLFAAGAGVASFRKIEDQVRDEANDLFKPGGSRPRINELLATLREEQRKLRELQLPNEKWDAHFSAHQAALADRATVAAELERAEQERNRLRRIGAGLPLLGKRKSIKLELLDYASAPNLSERFSEKRQKAVQALRLEEQNEAQGKQRIERLGSELSALNLSPAILGFSKEISELHQKLGSHRKALAERPKLLVQKKALEEQARELLLELRADFPFEKVQELRPRPDEEIIIRDLSSKRAKYMANLENALEKSRELTVQIAEINDRLARVPVPQDIAGLRTALEEARSCQRIEEELWQIEATLLGAQEQAESDLAGLAPRPESLEELERRRVPDVETIEDFETRIRETGNKIAERTKEIEKISREIRKIESKVLALRAGEVVSIEDLDSARSLRQTGWKLVRRALEGETVLEDELQAFIATSPGTCTLPDAFEKSVGIADELCDRLRREADRVAEYDTLVVAKNSLELERSEALRAKEKIERLLVEIEREWAGLWVESGFSPAPPGRMRRWAAKRAELVRAKREIRKLWSDAQYRSNRLEELRGALAQCLLEFGRAVESSESLREMVAKAAHALETQIGIATERDRLENDLRQKKAELLRVESQTGKASSELEQWQAQWAKAIAPLGLCAQSIPEQANAMVEKLHEIFTRLKESKDLGLRVNEWDTDCEVFEKQTAELVALAAPQLCGTPAEEAVRALNDLLTNARAEKIRRDDLGKKTRHEEQELGHCRGRIDKLKNEISGLLSEAACEEIEDLPEAERRSAAKKELLEKLGPIEEQLIELASGLSIEEFSTQTEEFDPDLLAPLIRQLDENIATLHAKKSELDQTIGSEKNELARMDGRGDAAELAQQIQSRLVDLENTARQYSRLKIAHGLLLKAKERHRDRSQGPVLKRTSQLFCALTLGAFEGIRAGEDFEKNAIVGLRRGGEIVPARAMSEGTADQLYLALRLASFEHYVSSNEPLPLVLDDILVQFDNERAGATLGVLAEVSKIAQIIMFTHHRHLVELAKSAIASDRLFAIDLPSSFAAKS
ncbi:MAG: AAA family ATPase [Syntrophobacteraceae bacterium]|nr:AAA family ATPase [Syntrophobacteraceae bacterium]